MYPHALPAERIVSEMRAQAVAAEAAGFDGILTSEHHGGFPGYLPNPLQAAGWLLDATETLWAAPCPLLLPLRHWTQVAEDLAWMAARFPGRVGGGFAIGGLAQDFEMADLPYDENLIRFKEALPRVVEALRGRTPEPLALDPAIIGCKNGPIPLVSAAQSPGAVRRAARLDLGLLYDSLQTVERTRQLSDAYLEAGGTGTRIAIRRVWVGAQPVENEQAQMNFYRSYAKTATQKHWGEGEELIAAESGAELADRLATFCENGGVNALNLRLHLTGLAPEAIRDQVHQIGSEVLPPLKQALSQTIDNG